MASLGIIWQKSRLLAATAGLLLAVAVGGCRSPEPFADQDNWLIRENARPHYFAPYDIFYLAPYNYTGRGNYPYEAHGAAVTETVDQFGVHTRVFAPLFHDAEDVENAFEHYLSSYHGPGRPWPFNGSDRPFVFVGEGPGGRLLAAFEHENERWLRKNGFLGGWYSGDTVNGFVTEMTVKDISEAVKAELYRRSWARDEK